MVRVARRLFGSKADPEQIGAALLALPFLALAVWVSWDKPWTLWGVVLSAYYFVAILLLLVADLRLRRPAGMSKGIRGVMVAMAAGLFLMLLPSALAGTLEPDVAHAGALFFAGAILGAVLAGVRARPGETRPR